MTPVLECPISPTDTHILLLCNYYAQDSRDIYIVWSLYIIHNCVVDEY